MKDLLKITAATAALALGVSNANAAMLLYQDENDNKVVVNTETEQRFSVVERTGREMVDCPDGSFLIDSQAGDETQIVTDCTTDTAYRMGPADDTFRAQGYPEGAFLLSPEEGQADDTEVTTEEEAESPGRSDD